MSPPTSPTSFGFENSLSALADSPSSTTSSVFEIDRRDRRVESTSTSTATSPSVFTFDLTKQSDRQIETTSSSPYSLASVLVIRTGRDNKTTTFSGPLRTFTCFKKLPSELKLRIMEDSFEQERRVEVRFPCRSKCHKHDFVASRVPWLAVNREMRTEALKFYKCLANEKSINGAFFHPKLDTLLLRPTYDEETVTRFVKYLPHRELIQKMAFSPNGLMSWKMSILWHRRSNQYLHYPNQATPNIFLFPALREAILLEGYLDILGYPSDHCCWETEGKYGTLLSADQLTQHLAHCHGSLFNLQGNKNDPDPFAHAKYLVAHFNSVLDEEKEKEEWSIKLKDWKEPEFTFRGYSMSTSPKFSRHCRIAGPNTHNTRNKHRGDDPVTPPEWATCWGTLGSR